MSYLRIVATLAVVWLHTNGTIFGNQELFTLTDNQVRWFAVNYYLMKWAVPIFLMITGALLLQHKKITICECIFKYSRRQLFAILLFGSMYAAMIEVSSNGLSTLIIAKSIIGSVTGNTSSHLWYSFLLIGIYLILPVLGRFIDSVDNKEVIYLLVVLFMFDFLLPFINTLFSIKLQFNIPFTYALFYLLCGYYFYTNSIRTWICGVVICVMMAIIALCAYSNPIIGLRCLDYSSPIVALLAISLFCCFKKLQNIKGSRALWKIDRLCFGVYLMHPLFIQVFYRILGFTPVKFSTYHVDTFLIYWIVVVLSFELCFVVNKIPVINKYIL